ncbi:CLUMA_CG007211, isoform A [Clunio marinus]|uniref:CLUMA_CG007211, isoform A n=1 Tax=Clunio marinus TaxID=568069 RepID=A0A1J1I1Q1_9DIPT|nr:CLUMA_CG007211, isoform A [Clunio marinus]
MKNDETSLSSSACFNSVKMNKKNCQWNLLVACNEGLIGYHGNVIQRSKTIYSDDGKFEEIKEYSAMSEAPEVDKSQPEYQLTSLLEHISIHILLLIFVLLKFSEQQFFFFLHLHLHLNQKQHHCWQNEKRFPIDINNECSKPYRII